MTKIDFNYIESNSGPVSFEVLSVGDIVLNFDYPNLGEHTVVEDFTGTKRLLRSNSCSLLDPRVVSKQKYINVLSYKKLGEVTAGQIVKWPNAETYYIVSSGRNQVTRDILMYGINNTSCICAAPDSSMVMVVGNINAY